MDGYPPTYWIIGYGHFGRRAAEKLLQKNPLSKVIVVDKSRKVSQKEPHLPVEIVIRDGVSYLSQFLLHGRKADYIVPAVPIHLAFEFILSQLKPLGAKRRKLPFVTELPNLVIGKTGDHYTSLANFLCPEDCPEPAHHCTFTKKRREKALYEILTDLKGPFKSKVIRSYQLAQGVGGFRPKALLALLEEIKKKRKAGKTILISTASRCHGVTSALSF